MNKIRAPPAEHYTSSLKPGLMIKCYYNLNVTMIVMDEKMIKMKYISTLHWVIYDNKSNSKKVFQKILLINS